MNLAASSSSANSKSTRPSSNDSGDFKKIFSSVEKKNSPAPAAKKEVASGRPGKPLSKFIANREASVDSDEFSRDDLGGSNASGVDSRATQAEDDNFEERSIGERPNEAFRPIGRSQYSVAQKVGATQPSTGKGPSGVVQNKIEERQTEENVDNLTHRQALQTLLKRMKDELGVEAGDLVDAFASLTPEELLQSPQANLDKIVAALPLDANQIAVAKSIFQDMLKQTASNSMADYLKTSNRQLSLEVMSRTEASQKNLNSGLEAMQSEFFLNQPQVAKGPTSPAALARYQSQSMTKSAAPQMQARGDEQTSVLPASMQGDLATQGTEGISLEGLDSEAFSGLEEGAGALSGLGKNASFATRQGAPAQGPDSFFAPFQPQNQVKAQPVLNANSLSQLSQSTAQNVELANESEVSAADLLGGDGRAQALGIDMNSLPVASAASKMTAQSVSEAASAPLGMLGMNAGNAADNEASDEELSDGQSDSGVYQAAQAQAKHGPAATGNTNTFIVPTQPTKVEQAANIKEIVSQAQFMAKKGGGEMKVSLTPEGLGQVTMKVSVQGGQVSVEMVAQSNEAKKVIERGLGELKATLMANHLKVDLIKVDTPADVSRQLTQQHDDAQRQFAQQFMEQFRHDNNQWRGGFYDIGGARGYRSQKEEAEQNPVTRANQGKQRTNGRRLDLVA